tara:strand:+ start:763 stop:894 length:132 start_codon:yes stop_codon:yes gene_type:complete
MKSQPTMIAMHTGHAAMNIRSVSQCDFFVNILVIAATGTAPRK